MWVHLHPNQERKPQSMPLWRTAHVPAGAGLALAAATGVALSHRLCSTPRSPLKSGSFCLGTTLHKRMDGSKNQQALQLVPNLLQVRKVLFFLPNNQRCFRKTIRHDTVKVSFGRSICTWESQQSESAMMFWTRSTLMWIPHDLLVWSLAPQSAWFIIVKTSLCSLWLHEARRQHKSIYQVGFSHLRPSNHCTLLKTRTAEG